MDGLFGSSDQENIISCERDHHSVQQNKLLQLPTMSDFTTADAFLPAAYQVYVKQYTIPVPDDYANIWQPTLGDSHPVRDEILLLEGKMPGLDLETWKQEHPGEYFPIHPGIDRGFPGRWKGFVKQPSGIQNCLHVLA